jgi:hypothetical protein
MLGYQMKLTAENAKTKPDEDLLVEFKRLFGNESPDATKWAWEAWRGKSLYWPAISEILTLYKDFHRGQREQAELIARQEEKRRLEEGRKRGEVVEFPTLVKELKLAAAVEAEPARRLREFDERMAQAADSMRSVASALETLHLTEEQIQARREKEREEMRRYGEQS